VAPLAAPASAAMRSSKSAKAKQALITRVAQAATKTSTAVSFHVTANIVVKVDGNSTTIAMSGGEIPKPLSAEFTEVLGGSGTPTPINVEVLGSTVYVNTAKTAAGVPIWYYIPISQVASTLGLGGASTFNFAQSLLFTNHAVSAVTKVGVNRLAGLKATEYRLQINVAQALGSSTSGQSFTNSLLGHLAAIFGTQTLTESMWVDRTGYIRKQTIQAKISRSYLAKLGAGSKATGQLSESLVFSHFGLGLFVIAPPASEVQPLPTSLQGSGTTGSTL
jgi:hypothetical protein